MVKTISRPEGMPNHVDRDTPWLRKTFADPDRHEAFMEWMRSVGMDPEVVSAFTIEGDGITVELLCEEGGSKHIPRACPIQRTPPPYVDDRACRYTEFI